MPKYSLQKQNSTISFEIQLPQRQAELYLFKKHAMYHGGPWRLLEEARKS